jgi:hypothetical protein
MNRDAFSFPNFSWDWVMWKSYVKQQVNNLLWDPAGVSVLLGAFGTLAEKGGHCYGMAYASILYYKQPTAKPVSKDTYEMTESEAVDDIRNYYWKQIPGLIPIITPIIGHHDAPKAEYTKAESYIKSDIPVIVGESSEDGEGEHAVVGYKIIKELNEDGSPKRAILFTYDNNYPLPLMTDTSNQRMALFGFGSTDGTVSAGGTWSGYSYWTKYSYVDISVPESVSSAPQGSDAPSIVKQNLDTRQIYQDLYDYTLQKLIADDQIMIVLGSSTANGLITDTTGKRIGYVGGTLVNEIPGASYDVADTSQVEVYLLPADDTYTVNGLGASDDTFDLHTLVPKSDNAVEVTIYEEVQTTASSVATINVSRNNTDFELQNDLDGDGTTDQTEPPDNQGTATIIGNNVYLPIILK